MLLYTQDNAPLDNVAANIEQESAETQKVRPEMLDVLVQTERTMRAMDETNHALKVGPCLILYIPSRLEALKFWTTSRITIGRTDRRRDVHPTIDLTNDYGYRLGISRIHAEIFYHEGTYQIRDLGSTNGTWVNNEQVVPPAAVPIQYGDSIRLGHMVMQVG
jgi:pSer/pThr/pTyr-binding forkhead associated (FHA) protein